MIDISLADSRLRVVEGDIVVESDIIEPEPVDSDAAAEEAAASDPLSQGAKS